MNLLESVRVALEGIMTSKLRSFLTTLGIVIGIAAVIAVVAIGQGGRAVLMAEMEKIGTNIFAIYVDWRSDKKVTGREFNLSDVAVIKDKVPDITHLSPVNNSLCDVRGPKDQKTGRVIGVSSDYFYIRKFNMKEGHFFTEEDDAGKRRVAVLDEELAGQVFGRAEALGSMITLNSTPFLVVGILAKSESALGFSENPGVYVPIQAWQVMFDNQVQELEGSAASKEKVDEAMGQAVKVLERRHQTPGKYAGMSMEQEMQAANKITGIMTLIIGAIAGISLFVGGIGVMNIMLVSVTERTREIGIRMALGARRRDILVQFLIESIMLCLLGGIIGMALGAGGAYLIAKLAKWPPLVSWWTALLAFAFSAAIGVVFGLLPANKAARLNPIEALRRE
ncbi:ABC transporter permease [Pelotomaculum sp. PtaB.Bin117]|uniref:ABC transporter permease n=1 Tax=Pelotomaculum sp. PtaB.Bin117 TaxID=1811694 RepID=UPI0009CBFE15|nr:ABC transporter permease [Pelotomaculum sp. PtaB.Bin117]OPX89395.1 MAG: putative ABC transporter permease YknZ [Pelotomaculum sp. PtaB.Bin117]OPY61792.1 MAG: putative ABC transporter permease YknZ [Pelotomaculum sp. PtaU1.Bin065]